MLHTVYYGKIDGSYKCNQLLSAGTIVKADPANAGFVIPATAGDYIMGVLLQDVIATNVDNFKLSSVTHKARQGVDQVGVGFGDAVHVTDQFSGNISQGAPLYVGTGATAGLLVATAPTSGNTAPVAIAELAANSASGNTLRYKALV